MTPFGRCETAAERKALLKRLLAVWDKTPALRLGQLVSNAAVMSGVEPFYVEDASLLAGAEEMVTR